MFFFKLGNWSCNDECKLQAQSFKWKAESFTFFLQNQYIDETFSKNMGIIGFGVALHQVYYHHIIIALSTNLGSRSKTLTIHPSATWPAEFLCRILVQKWNHGNITRKPFDCRQDCIAKSQHNQCNSKQWTEKINIVQYVEGWRRFGRLLFDRRQGTDCVNPCQVSQLGVSQLCFLIIAVNLS